MKDESSIYDAEPENLDRLVFEILGEPEAEQDSGSAATVDGVFEQLGGRIGRYKLISVLGEGGMGIVYLAEQQEPIRRKVALKVIKPGMDSKRVMARFEAERQALALLDHPNIAHVYDAGSTESGRPFFVMEYVKGLPITEHCDHHKLTIEDRLRLFQQVCQAVQHAHQKGIIHRDIKPSNILVSTQDDQAVPKIIDFGVAKALAQPLTERTLATEDSQLLGTPEYMSPEQADMATEDIDTRSDIYSLGVLLYVMLTGVLPFDSDTLREGGIENIRKTIRETDPKTPSTRLAKLGDEAKKLAENRCMEIHTLARHLKKELEWIPLKAMRKERSERYRSASELADDIENYLNGLPLIAARQRTGYKVKKFVRRNRVLVGGVGVVLAVLTIGVTVSTVLAIGQARARAEAQIVADFLKSDVLMSASRIKGREATVVDALDAAAAKLDDGEFRDHPRVEASIREVMATIYSSLGWYAVAAQQQESAYRIRVDQLAGDGPVPLNWLAVYYYWAGMYREAEPLYQQVLEECLERDAEYPIRKRHLWLVWNANLGVTRGALGRFEEAEFLVRPLVEESPGPSYGLCLGRIYRELGRYEAAERVLRESLNTGRKRDEEDRSWRFVAGMVRCMHELGLLRLAQGDDEEAEKLFAEGIEYGSRELPGKDHPHTLRNVHGLATIRIKQERYEEAERLLERVLTGQELKLGKDHPRRLQTMNTLGLLRRAQKRYENAEQLLLETFEGRKVKLGYEHPHTLLSMYELAVLYKEKGDYEKAEPLLLEALEGRRLKLGDTHPHIIESWKNLIDLYDAWNKPEKAEEWRAKLPQMEDSEE